VLGDSWESVVKQGSSLGASADDLRCIVPLSPEEFHARALKSADPEGRLPLSRMTDWDVFPFEQGRTEGGPAGATFPA